MCFVLSLVQEKKKIYLKKKMSVQISDVSWQYKSL